MAKFATEDGNRLILKMTNCRKRAVAGTLQNVPKNPKRLLPDLIGP